MKANSLYPDLVAEPNPVPKIPLTHPIDPAIDPASENTTDEVIEELEASVSGVKDEITRLATRLRAVEHRLSTLKPETNGREVNVRMASFHHVYDPAHRTW